MDFTSNEYEEEWLNENEFFFQILQYDTISFDSFSIGVEIANFRTTVQFEK